MKPTLLILAAGMGSRFGGLKQVEPVGPNGEAIIDYSIYDAIRAGFGKVVLCAVQKTHRASCPRSRLEKCRGCRQRLVGATGCRRCGNHRFRACSG